MAAMPTRKPQHSRVKVSEYGEQQLEALGYPARMEFELNDGSVVELVHPWLWPDDIQVAHDAAQSDTSSAESRAIRIARAVLGPEQHERFIAGGGKSSQVMLAIEMMRVPHDKMETDPKGK